MGKNSKNHNRTRNITVCFRMTEAERDELYMRTKLSGLSKQKYMIDRLLQRDFIVIGNPQVYKALRDKHAEILDELKQLRGGDEINAELLTAIQAVTETLKGLNQNNEKGL